MWLDPKQQDNELKNPSQEGGPSVGAGSSGAEATGANGTTANNTTSMTPLTSTKQTPQKFATVQDYLKTNQPQAEDLGQKFTNQLDTTYGNQKSTIDSAANQAKSDINSGAVSFNQDLVNDATEDPTKIVDDPNKYALFNKQWNASYAGPESFEKSNSYNQAAGALNNANQIKGQLGTTGGREQLIQDQFGVYGQGNRGLDQALLQSSSAFPAVQGKEAQFGSIQDYLNQQSQSVNPNVAKAKETTDNTKAAFQNAFTGQGGIVPTFQNSLQERTTNKIAEANKNNADLQSAIENNKALTADQIKLLGISPEQYNLLLEKNREAASPDLYTSTASSSVAPETNITNLKDYLTVKNPAAQISKENTATTQDYARDAALAKLTGGSSFLNQGEIGKAGTANTDAVDFNYENALQNYLSKIGDYKSQQSAAAAAKDADLKAQQAIDAEKDAEKTDKRQLLQLIGNVQTGGIAPAYNAVTDSNNKITDKIDSKIDKNIGQDLANPIKDAINLANPITQIENGVNIARDPLTSLVGGINNVGSSISDALGLSNSVKDAGPSAAQSITKQLHSNFDKLVQGGLQEKDGIIVIPPVEKTGPVLRNTLISNLANSYIPQSNGVLQKDMLSNMGTTEQEVAQALSQEDPSALQPSTTTWLNNYKSAHADQFSKTPADLKKYMADEEAKRKASGTPQKIVKAF